MGLVGVDFETILRRVWLLLKESTSAHTHTRARVHVPLLRTISSEGGRSTRNAIPF